MSYNMFCSVLFYAFSNDNEKKPTNLDKRVAVKLYTIGVKCRACRISYYSLCVGSAKNNLTRIESNNK